MYRIETTRNQIIREPSFPDKCCFLFEALQSKTQMTLERIVGIVEDHSIQKLSLQDKSNQERTKKKSKPSDDWLSFNLNRCTTRNMGELVDELKIWEHTNKDKGHKLKEKKNTRTSMVATFRKENIQDQEPRYLSFIHPRPTYHQRLYKRSLSKTKRFHIEE